MRKINNVKGKIFKSNYQKRIFAALLGVTILGQLCLPLGNGQITKALNEDGNNVVNENTQTISGNTQEQTTQANDSETVGKTTLRATAGDQCVKLNWDAVDGDGYQIYQRKTIGLYELLFTIENAKTTEYKVSSLSNGVTYGYRICAIKKSNVTDTTDTAQEQKNVIEGALSNEVVVTPVAGKKTSSSAYLFSSTSKFKSSAAYKTYALAKKINTSKCFVTPGIATTNVDGINSLDYVAQGNVCAKTYYFQGAYDKTGENNSVIYVMKRSTHEYVMTLVLPGKNKVTDMAFDGVNIWVTDGNQIGYFTYAKVTNLITTGLDSAPIYFAKTFTTVSKPQYLAYYNDMLWVGEYSLSDHYMSGYKIENKTTEPALTYAKKMKMFAKTTAIEIDDSGYLYVVRSYRQKKAQSGYISQVRTYLPTWSTATESVKKNSYIKVCKLPAMSSGVAFYNTYAYIGYSSANDTVCKYPTDRTWAIKLTYLR